MMMSIVSLRLVLLVLALFSNISFLKKFVGATRILHPQYEQYFSDVLRGIDVEVVLIGDTTCGKPFGFFPQDNCGTTYFTIQIQSVNDKGFGAYQDGFRPVTTPNFDDELPGCRVADDLTSPLAVESEPLLATAIHYLENGSCPVTASTQKGDSLNQIDAARVNAQQESRNLRRDVILKSIAQETYIEIREP
jgi:hypothetical protein